MLLWASWVGKKTSTKLTKIDTIDLRSAAEKAAQKQKNQKADGQLNGAGLQELAQQQEAARPKDSKTLKNHRNTSNKSCTKKTNTTSERAKHLIDLCEKKMKLILKKSQHRRGVAYLVSDAKAATAAALEQLAVVEAACSMLLGLKQKGQAQAAKKMMQMANREIEMKHTIVNDVLKQFK